MQEVPQQMTSPRLDLPCIAFHSLDRSTVLFSMFEHKRIVHGDTDEVLRNKQPVRSFEIISQISQPAISIFFS
jgi:hypothetical protein